MDMAKRLSIAFSMAAFCLGGLAGVAKAVTITDFEGDIVAGVPGGPVTSVAGSVVVQSASSFTASPPAALDCGGSPSCLLQGQWAYLTTGPGSTGAGSSGLDRTGALGPEIDIASMMISFETTQPGNIHWTSVVLSGEDTDPDPIEILLDGASVFRMAIGADNGAFPGRTSFFDVTIGGPDGEFYDKSLGFSYVFPIQAGIHTLDFFVGDAVTNLGDTALLVDQVIFTPVPEPTTTILLGLGLAGLAARRRR